MSIQESAQRIINEVSVQAELIAQIEKALGKKGGYSGDLYSYGTATVNPGSGVHQVSFNNIPKEPDYFILYLNSADIGQYHRAGVIVYDGESIYGQEYYSGTDDCYFYENANSASNYRWRYTYSGTTLTISSYSNSQGGYFHNPGTYTLRYAYKDNEKGTVAIEKKTVTSANNAMSLSFGALDGEPVWYAAILRGNQDAQANSMGTIVFANEGGYAHTTGASSANFEYVSSSSHDSYAGGTLTVSQGTERFSNNEYALIYAYEPVIDSGNGGTDTSGASIKTITATPTSNSTSIAFTGLSAQPKMFSLVPKENITFNTSNRFVVNVAYDGTGTHGMYAAGSGSYNATYTGTYSASHFTWTYSNGTLTVRTNSATNGGNFANGVDYQLTCII